MTSNLTRDEAATRSALIAVSSYQVDLDLTGDEKTFRSVSVIRFACAAPGSSTFVNLTAPAVHEITLNDEPVGLDAFDGDRITLTGLAADNVLRVDFQPGPHVRLSRPFKVIRLRRPKREKAS